MKQAITSIFTILLAALAFAAIASTAEAGNRTLLTGFGDEAYRADSAAKRAKALDLTNSVNGEVVRLSVDWRSIAPKQPTPNFDPTDPADHGLRLETDRR